MNAIQIIKNALLFTAVGIILSTGSALGQISPQQKEDIEARRIGFITKELNLTPEEAQVFWPVYNKYRNELGSICQKKQTDLLGTKVNLDSFSNEQVSKLIDSEMDRRQKELDLQVRYNVEFRKVLPVKKVARLYRAEQQFKISLIRDRDTKPSGQGQGSRQGGTQGQPKKMNKH